MSDTKARIVVSLLTFATVLVGPTRAGGEPPKPNDGATAEVLESTAPLLKTVRLRGAGTSAAFLPDGKTLLTAGGKKHAILSWDTVAGKLLAEWPADPGGSWAVGVSPSRLVSSVVVSTSQTGFTVWDAKERVPIGRIRTQNGGGSVLGVSADGRVLIADPYRCRLFDLGTKAAVRIVPEGVTGELIAVAPDCKTFLALEGGTLRLWRGGRDKVPAQEIADGVPPERLLLGDAARGKLLHEIRLSGTFPRSASFSADGKTLLVLDSDIHLVAWDVKTGKELRRWDRMGNNIWVIAAVSSDGRWVAAIDRVGQGTVWDVVSGGRLLTFSAQPFAYSPLTFSPDGRALAVGAADGTVLVYELVPRSGPGGPTAKELDALWALMTGRDDQEPAANRALFVLAGAPKQAVPFLKERLRPPPSADPIEVKKLIVDLNSDEVAVRDAAFERLHKLGVAAADALRAALKDPPSAEVRVRLKVLLMAAEDMRTLRPGRAVRALEVIDSDASRRALAELANQKGDPWLAGEANAALDRLLIPRADHK